MRNRIRRCRNAGRTTSARSHWALSKTGNALTLTETIPSMPLWWIRKRLDTYDPGGYRPARRPSEEERHPSHRLRSPDGHAQRAADDDLAVSHRSHAPALPTRRLACPGALWSKIRSGDLHVHATAEADSQRMEELMH